MHAVLIIITLAVAASANTKLCPFQVCFGLLTLLQFVRPTKLNVWAMPGLEKA